MGWYNSKCHKCHDSHEGTCEEFQRARALAEAQNLTHRLIEEQNQLIREQIRILKGREKKHGRTSVRRTR